MLTAAAVCAAGIALLHVGIAVAGPAAYRFFGAGEELARRAEAGSAVPALLTLGIGGVFAAFALYALSGSGRVRPLPLRRMALLVIAGLFLLRGLAFFPQLLQLGSAAGTVQARQLVFSGVSLFIGILYLAGTARAWRRLSRSP